MGYVVVCIPTPRFSETRRYLMPSIASCVYENSVFSKQYAFEDAEYSNQLLTSEDEFVFEAMTREDFNKLCEDWPTMSITDEL